MADKSRLPIGVFDSGMGGLTVLKQLIADHPNESFIYLGDTARLPYGTKSAATVGRYALQAAQCLLERKIKMLVVACNTASTALPLLTAQFPALPIIGVVEPGAQAAIAATKNKRVAVLATETTIASNIYQATIKRLAPDVSVFTQPCSLFVALAEEGLVTGDIVDHVIAHYLKPLFTRAPDCDSIVLGCTHFPVLADAIAASLPSSVRVINSAQVASNTVAHELARLNLSASHHAPRHTFLVTDQAERFARVGKLFFGQDIPLSRVELVDLSEG